MWRYLNSAIVFFNKKKKVADFSEWDFFFVVHVQYIFNIEKNKQKLHKKQRLLLIKV